MNGHGLTSTTRSRSSTTNWTGISSDLENRTGRDQPLVVQYSQSSLQPTPIPSAERQLDRAEILAAVPNCAAGSTVDNQI